MKGFYVGSGRWGFLRELGDGWEVWVEGIGCRGRGGGKEREKRQRKEKRGLYLRRLFGEKERDIE